MALFSKKKLKRVHADRMKAHIFQPEDSPIKTRRLTNILLGVLAIAIILAFLGLGRFNSLSAAITLTVVTSGLVFIAGFYLLLLEPEMFSSFIKILSFILISLSVFIFIVLFDHLKWSLYYLPVTLITMIIAVGYSRQLAIVNVFFQLFLLWAWNHPSFSVFITHCPSAVICALVLVDIRTRAKIIRLGMASGAALFIMVCIKGILEGHYIQIGSFKSISDVPFINNAFLGFVNGAVSGFILLGILPFLEKRFGVMTNLSLLELADLNQPLLRRLSLEAPGTYHHSLRVGDLARAAAESIGADGMLARVGAYYHDIGKLNKPEYFVENEAGAVSKHKDLSPTMSTLIITAHVKDGLEMAKEEKLPKRIQEFVSRHHGTSVMKYFYHEAKEKTNNHHQLNLAVNGKKHASENSVDAESFRYPGPKVESKEVSIVMLADAVEATSRTLTNVSPSKVEGMVHDIIMSHVMDGQLEESNLTMHDLKQVEEAFVRVLAGIFHARVEYPKDDKD